MADVGIEYGVALYELAEESDLKDVIYNDLCILNECFLEDRLYLKLLSSPSIPKSERYGLVDKAFRDMNLYTRSYIKILIKNNHVKQFFDAFYHYETMYNESLNIKKAVVTTSISLNDEDKEKIRKVLSDREKANVYITYKINKEILGGIVIDIDGKKLDGSLKRKLSDIRKVMTK